MDQIMVENFRCFRERQTARMALLTLLVGENSTGKTSFLALLKALWDIAYHREAPDFTRDPFNLGSFDEIVHHRGSRAESFGMGFCAEHGGVNSNSYCFELTFEEGATAPIPVRIFRSLGKIWVEEYVKIGQGIRFLAGTPRGVWECELPYPPAVTIGSYSRRVWPPLVTETPNYMAYEIEGDKAVRFEPVDGSPPISSNDLESLRELSEVSLSYEDDQVFISAPVRTKPQRTYNPSRPISDPEGDYVPMYLANLFSQDERQWKSVKAGLEEYGKAAGLFDEISIRRLGRRDSEPFQVQVRKFGGRLKGPRRNIIDMGYGVSQVLPIVTELLRRDGAATSLFSAAGSASPSECSSRLGESLLQTRRFR